VAAYIEVDVAIVAEFKPCNTTEIEKILPVQSFDATTILHGTPAGIPKWFRCGNGQQMFHGAPATAPRRFFWKLFPRYVTTDFGTRCYGDRPVKMLYHLKDILLYAFERVLKVPTACL
jgi:hypothetical protein